MWWLPVEVRRPGPGTPLGTALVAATVATALLVAAVPASQGFDPVEAPVRSTCLQQDGSVWTLDALGDGRRVGAFYDYRDAEAHTGLERRTTTNLLLWDGPGGLSLVLVHGKPGTRPGHLVLEVADLPGDGRWAVEDDPPDFDRLAPPFYEWRWNEKHTDGGAFRGLADHLESGERIRITHKASSGIHRWQAVAGSLDSPSRIDLDLGKAATVGPCETRLEADPVVAGAGGSGLDPLTVSATLANNATGEPIADALVRFEAPTADGPRPLCRAETNATGVASCGVPGSQARAVASGGYEAVYRGTTLHAPSSDEAPVAEIGGEPVPAGPLADATGQRPDPRALPGSDPSGPAHPAFAEAGRTTVADDDWEAANLSVPLGGEPLVFATTQTENGGEDASVAHVRGVGADGFETQHCEYEAGDNCDGGHAAEENGWIALRPDGVDAAPGVEAGTVTLADDDRTQVSLSGTAGDLPLVFATVQTRNGGQDPRTVRAVDRTSASFTLKLCEWDSFLGCDSHAAETVAWWAVDPAAARGEVLDWGEVAVTNSTWRNVTFDQDFQVPPVVHATVQTENGTDRVPIPEVRNVSAEGAQVRYCAHEAYDGCADHPGETVAWVAVAPGRLDYPTPSPPRNVTADPGPGVGQVTISWDRPRGDGGFDRSAYHVYRGPPDGDFGQATRVATAPPDAGWAVDPDAPLEPHRYWVTAANEAFGESAPSHPDCTRPFPWVGLLDGGLCPGSG